VINSQDYFADGIFQIIVDNRDANGDPTGVTNLDDLTFTAFVEQTFVFARRQVRSINADLQGGDDFFINNINRTSIVDGGDGNDTLIGGGRSDILLGGNGNDFIFGGRGRDIIIGGNDDDSLFGDEGRDLIIGGDGADTIDGGRGRDILLVDALDTVLAGREDLVLSL